MDIFKVGNLGLPALLYTSTYICRTGLSSSTLPFFSPSWSCPIPFSKSPSKLTSVTYLQSRVLF
jgi:hypothetical protein